VTGGDESLLPAPAVFRPQKLSHHHWRGDSSGEARISIGTAAQKPLRHIELRVIGAPDSVFANRLAVDEYRQRDFVQRRPTITPSGKCGYLSNETLIETRRRSVPA